LREAGHGDIKVVVVMLVNVTDEVDTMGEATLYGLPFFFSGWRVTTESEDIPAPMSFCFLN
jgi:hypothetical protein